VTAFIASTRPDATAWALVVSCATPTVTDSVVGFVTVTVRPGTRSVKVFVALVTTCSAAVPAQSVTLASFACVTTAAPVSVRTFVAEPAVTSAPVPRYTWNAPAAPVFADVSWRR
jgi:hypothetical protein